MRKISSGTRPRRLACLSVVAITFAIAIGASNQGFAQEREFVGQVDRVTQAALSVDSLQGDNLSFVRGRSTEVEGARSKWESIERGDSVVVVWDFLDPALTARKVIVTDPRSSHEGK